jgi:hypothetical protein
METAVQAFLSSYPPEVRDLTLKLRALVFEVIPNALEQVDVPNKILGYGFSLNMADIICVIAPYTSHVILMFGKGTELRDPEGLLKGTEKHVRHVKIQAASDIEAPALRTLLEKAVAAQQS